MTCEEARQYLWREPFEPVRIRLKDGRSFTIPQRRFTLAAEAILIIGLPAHDDPDSIDRQLWVQWSDVDAIEPLPRRAAPTV
jgi:hypothetical protein